jgi:hypothetical protein
LAALTMSTRAAAVTIIVCSPPPKAAATYEPANMPAAGEPAGTVK